MASEENVKNDSCIDDPNFAVVCSFFENFSSLCGIQPLSFSELQQMLEDTQFTAPPLIDLHIRLMRKAKKNVNPERWQRTLARFCWLYQPDDCWILEQKGYQHLNYSQRLRILLTLIGAQFDHNTKFKTDVNKLDVKDLRLQPVGRDKNGHNYWAHMDQETTLKVYKEDLDEEKWELVVQDREDLVKLIEDLTKDKDPNRKLEELEESEESESSSEEEEEPPAPAEVSEENVENDQARKDDVSNTRSNSDKKTPSEAQFANSVSKPPFDSGARKTVLSEKLQQALSEVPLKKSSLTLISRPRSSNASAPVKPLDKESFAQHLQKLDSINMLKPLLSSTEPGEEMNPAAIKSDLLKTKINQKFSIIKPTLQSKLESTGKTSKPGLKLEQILKSKLAQKLSSGNAPSEAATKSGEEAENCKKSEDTECAIRPCVDDLSVKNPRPKDGEDEIEESVMVVNGVGNGHDCNSINYEDDEIEESIMFVYGVGSGSECATGNNENEESSNKNVSHASHLTHKVDNMLGKSETETPPSTSAVETIDTEKKKPKLWTIDAICNSDSSKDSKRDCISQFPNYSFNKDSKKDNPIPYRSATESYSIFSLTESKDNRDAAATVIPTNFYFGSNNQNPCFLSTELSPSYKSKSHSVENIVEGVGKKAEAKITKFNAESLYSKTNNVNDAEKVATHSAVVRSSIGTAPEIVSTESSFGKVPECITEEQSASNRPSESVVTDYSSPSKVPEVVVTDQSNFTKAPELTVAARSHAKVDEKITLPVESAADVNQSTLNKEVKIEKETETVTSNELNPVEEPQISASHQTSLAVEPKSVPADSISQVLGPKPIPVTFENPSNLVKESETVAVDQSNVDAALSDSEPQPMPVVSENYFPQQMKTAKVVQSSPDTAASKNESTSPLIQAADDAVAKEVATSKSKQQPENGFDDRQPCAAVLGAEGERSKNESSESPCAISEEKSTAVENRISESVPAAVEISLPEAVSQTTTERFEAVKIPSPESRKTEDEQKSEETEADSKKTVKSEKVEPVRHIVRESNDETDKLPAQITENDEIGSQTDKKEDESSKEKMEDGADGAENEAHPIRKETRKPRRSDGETIQNVNDESSNASLPVQEDMKMDKQQEDSVAPETVADAMNDIEKAVDNVAGESTETRRTTRSSRAKKSDVECSSENAEKSKCKKLTKNTKPKIENVDSAKIGPRATRGSRSSDNEKGAVKLKLNLTKKLNDEKANLVKKLEDETESEQVADEETTENIEDVEKNQVENDDDATPKKETKKAVKKGKKKRRSYTKKTAKLQTPKKESSKAEQNHSEAETDSKDVGETLIKEEDDSSKKEVTEPKKRKIKRGWLNDLDVSNIQISQNTESPGIRQSRRIAQLKIREQAENKYQEAATSTKKAAAVNQKSKTATPTKKNKASKAKPTKFKPPAEESEEETYYEFSSSKKKRKKKKDQQPKKNFDPKKAWKQSSESSSEEEDEEDHFEEEDEELVINDKSDHEFSPESDIDEDDEYQPVKRARTAHSKPRAEDKAERDDLACQSCGTAEQPEWILLCDSCDEGWHAACLKPPVMAIPEGDWFCPPCQHNKLITGLQMFLRTYDKAVKKRASEESRRKRLEYVNISFSNIVKEEAASKNAERARSQSSGSSNESCEEESEEEEEPLYQLRVRRQANVRHRLNEYEELMNSAIERENVDVPAIPVETETNVNGGAEDVQNNAQVQDVNENKKKENGDESAEDEEEKQEQEQEQEQDQDQDKEGDDEKGEKEKGKEIHILLQLRNVRKKPARLTNLDVSSEDDHYSDEDFKGSSGDDQEEEDEYAKSETDSDEASYRRGRGGRGAVRRSTRARRTRYDNDFINDNSEDDDEEYGRKKKRKRVMYSESDSEEDSTWGRRKRNKNSVSHRTASSKKRKRIRFDGDSDDDRVRKKTSGNSRIKYGLDEDNEDYLPSRRTRGKKISYQDNLDSGSEEEEQSLKSRNKSRKIVSDDEYVNEEDEQNASKDSVASEKGEHSESGSKSDDSEGPKNRKQSKILESDDSDSSPVKATKTQEEKVLESPVKPAEPILEKIVVKTEPVNTTEKKLSPSSAQEAHLPKEIPEDVSVPAIPPPPEVDQNPSLQGMQSMAQNLSQPTMPPAQFTPNVLPEAPTFPGARIPVPQAPPVPVNYEVGVKYESSLDEMPPASVADNKTYPHPIRVPSPSKMYKLPADMQASNRPHLPPFMAPQIQPPILAPPPGAVAAAALPQSSRPMPPAIPIPRGSMPMQGPMHSRAPPPPNVNVGQCGPPAPMVPPNAIPSAPETPSPPKRRPRGRGKKQLEMERLQREREAMDAASRNEEMIPIHLLKNAGHPAIPPPFSSYQPMPFSQAPPSIQQQASGISTPVVTSSKRVKITPTRMRMTTPTADKMGHIPRSPGSAAMYPPVRHAPVPVSSPSGTGQPAPPDSKPPSVSGAPTSTLPVKTDTAPTRPESSDPSYYHPPTPYPPSQGPRMYGTRPEYAFARKPAPPGMYPPPPLTNTAPNVVVSRTGGFAPPPVSSPNMKSESPTTATTTNAPPTVPQSYPAQYRLPTTASPAVPSKPGGMYARPPGPPPTVSTAPSVYPVMHHHIKPPPQSPAGTPSYVPPYYAQSPYPSGPPPPTTQPPPVSFSRTVPPSNFSPNAAPPPNRIAHSQSPGASTTSETNTLNSLPPTSQGNEYQYSQQRPSGTSNEPEILNRSTTPSRYEEESPPVEETSTGEFGGLVSYFSSQHEDDLDT